MSRIGYESEIGVVFIDTGCAGQRKASLQIKSTAGWQFLKIGRPCEVQA